MTKKEKEIKSCIEFRIEAISKALNLPLKLDYNRSFGYSLYGVKGDGNCTSFGMCFINPSRRYNAAEMLAYVDGIWNFIIDLRYEKFVIKTRKED